jgi:hypothetical protein
MFWCLAAVLFLSLFHVQAASTEASVQNHVGAPFLAAIVFCSLFSDAGLSRIRPESVFNEGLSLFPSNRRFTE